MAAQFLHWPTLWPGKEADSWRWAGRLKETSIRRSDNVSPSKRAGE